VRDDIQLDAESELRAQANPFGGGIDWLEVRVPQDVKWRPRVEEIFGALRRREEMGSALKRSDHYAAVVDLRPFDVADAFLHVGKKQGEHNHKIQLVGSGQYSWGEHLSELESIVDCDPRKLQPMRTDLTVDIDDVSVGEVVKRVRAAGKRFHAKVGRINDEQDDREQFLSMGMRETQTYYDGKQPNCYRIYDKGAERKNAYAKFVRGWHPPEPSFEKWMRAATRRDGLAFEQFEALCYKRGWIPENELERAGRTVQGMRELFEDLHTAWEKKIVEIGPRPSFKEFCGLDESQVLTRFERQIGAQQVGKLYLVGDSHKRPIFSSIAELERNVVDFNPFASLSFSAPGIVEPALPNGKNYSLTTYMAGMYMRARILENGEGRGAFEKWATPLAKGNMKDIMERLAPFMPPEVGEGKRLTSEDLFERYRSAICKQLAA
jgi:hypothetical protein